MNESGLNGSTVNGAATPYEAPQTVTLTGAITQLPVAASMSASISLQGDVSDLFGLEDVLGVASSVVVADALQLHPSIAPTLIYTVVERLTLTAVQRGIASMTVAAFSRLALRDAVVLVRVAQALDTLQFSDGTAGTVEKIARALSILSVKDATLPLHELIARAAAVVALMDKPAPATLAEALDALTATDEAAGQLVMLAAIAESVLLAGDVEAGKVVLASLRDELVGSGAPAAFAEWMAKAHSEALFMGEFILLGEAYDAWAINAETGAASRYTNFSFDSLFNLHGRAYGTSADGLFRLDGDDDDGEQIMARIVTGELDFGTTAIKRMEQAWIAYASNGDMVLKVTVTHQGKREEHWYRSKSVGVHRTEAKLQIGRGLESHYWQFELVNAEGADFELDGLQFQALALSRRV